MNRIKNALERKMLAGKKDEGFSLIELLVVVIIIGILAAIAIPIYIGVQNNAKDSAIKSDLTNAKTAIVASYTATNTFPTDLTALGDYGYTSSGTATLTLKTGGAITSFCVSAPSVATPAQNIYINASGGVVGPTATKPSGC